MRENASSAGAIDTFILPAGKAIVLAQSLIWLSVQTRSDAYTPRSVVRHRACRLWDKDHWHRSLEWNLR